jgi:hypothetical protein
VKCVPDGADVTDVNIEVLASRAMLPSWELIVIWRKTRFAYRELRLRAQGAPRTLRVH